MNTWALLLAAGRGSRLAAQGVTTPKQFLVLDGHPLFWHSALTFARLAPLRGIVFVFPPDGEALARRSPATNVREHHSPAGWAWGGAEANAATDPPAREYASLVRHLDGRGSLGLDWRIAMGGERRQDSVRNALAALPADCDSVLVHDAARPFATAALMIRVLKALEDGHAAVIPGIAVSDTIKSVDASGRVLLTHERASLRAVQTPQGFALGPLRAAHARALEEGWEVTDDASLMERCDHPVLVVEGEEDNRKITTLRDARLSGLPLPGDAAPAPAVMCVGFGYDVHRYGGDRPFILGGVPIRTQLTLAAHSDGDVLLHALMDALLGCIGGGDIGGMFPDADPAYENIASGILLAEVLERTRRAGLAIDHADMTVVAQTPRIAPHARAIAANVAAMLQLPRGAVNLKATTEEHLGFTGEKKGIKAIAVVTGRRPALAAASGDSR